MNLSYYSLFLYLFVSADAKELETLSSEIRDDYVLAKQAAMEEKRKIAIEPSPVIKIK